jgi:uncharacterized protein with PIN domain
MYNRPEFVADENVGKLARSLRLLGYDTVFFRGETDSQIIGIALNENRIILTRDTHIMKRRLVTAGKIKAILICSDNIEEQIKQVVLELDLSALKKPFTLCLECNRLLVARTKEEVKERVPPYVFKTQHEFVECLECHRIYWKGTHWEAMSRMLEKLAKEFGEDEK